MSGGAGFFEHAAGKIHTDQSLRIGPQKRAAQASAATGVQYLQFATRRTDGGLDRGSDQLGRLIG